MKYDPILCMMVDDSVKTKDANKYVEKAIQLIKKGKGPLAILSALKEMGLTPVDANAYYAEARSQTGYRNNDSNILDKAIRSCDSRVSHRNVVTSNIAFEEIKKMTGIIPEKVQQKGDIMEFYHSGVKVAEWDMNNSEVKVFV